MAGREPSRITTLLRRLGEGESLAAEELVPLVYDELRRIAARHMQRGARQAASLQPTALVHEAWLRFSGEEGLALENRSEFFRLASRIMRSVLVDAARARGAIKRGAGARKVGLDPALLPDRKRPLDLVELEEALETLEARDPELARLVELRFFAGLTTAETARVLKVTDRTVERRWRLARAFLHGELE